MSYRASNRERIDLVFQFSRQKSQILSGFHGRPRENDPFAFPGKQHLHRFGHCKIRFPGPRGSQSEYNILLPHGAQIRQLIPCSGGDRTLPGADVDPFRKEDFQGRFVPGFGLFQRLFHVSGFQRSATKRLKLRKASQKRQGTVTVRSVRGGYFDPGIPGREKHAQTAAGLLQAGRRTSGEHVFDGFPAVEKKFFSGAVPQRGNLHAGRTHYFAPAAFFSAGRVSLVPGTRRLAFFRRDLFSL